MESLINVYMIKFYATLELYNKLTKYIIFSKEYLERKFVMVITFSTQEYFNLIDSQITFWALSFFYRNIKTLFCFQILSVLNQMTQHYLLLLFIIYCNYYIKATDPVYRSQQPMCICFYFIF